MVEFFHEAAFLLRDIGVAVVIFFFVVFVLSAFAPTKQQMKKVLGEK